MNFRLPTSRTQQHPLQTFSRSRSNITDRYDSLKTMPQQLSLFEAKRACRRADSGGKWHEVCKPTFKTCLWLLPVLLVFWIFCSLWICYGIAVGYDHVDPWFPAISYVAYEVPERGLFSQLMNIGSFIMVVVNLLRYVYLKSYGKWHKVNVAARIIGLIAALGLSMSANFEATYQPTIHSVAGSICFIGGFIYSWIETFLNYNVLINTKHGKLVFALQLLLSVISTITFIAFVALTVYLEDPLWAHLEMTRPFDTNDENKAKIHLAWTLTEWVMVISQLALALTYVPHFLRWKVKVIVLDQCNDNKRTRVYPDSDGNFHNDHRQMTPERRSSGDVGLRF